MVGGCLLPWLLLAGPVYLMLGERHILFSAVAAGLCLVPMVGTLLWSDLTSAKSPEQRLAAVLGGTALRIVAAVGLGMVIYFNVPAFKSAWFLLWILGFYLWTLAVEMVLVARRQAALDRAGHP